MTRSGVRDRWPHPAEGDCSCGAGRMGCGKQQERAAVASGDIVEIARNVGPDCPEKREDHHRRTVQFSESRPREMIREECRCRGPRQAERQPGQSNPYREKRRRHSLVEIGEQYAGAYPQRGADGIGRCASQRVGDTAYQVSPDDEDSPDEKDQPARFGGKTLIRCMGNDVYGRSGHDEGNGAVGAGDEKKSQRKKPF